MENIEQTNKLKEIMEELKKKAVWVGEDGNSVCNAKNEEEAFVLFKDLMIEAMGHDGPEVTEMKIENIGIGWLSLPEKENTEYDWFVSYLNPTPFEVWVYCAS